MNEIAAVLLYVMSVDPESAESDAFWCFSEMMVESWAGTMAEDYGPKDQS
jgi:hypothetical protein